MIWIIAGIALLLLPLIVGLSWSLADTYRTALAAVASVVVVAALIVAGAYLIDYGMTR